MIESTVKSSSEVHVKTTEKHIRILHVDNDSNFLRIAKELLEMQGGFQVDTARCVEEAKDKLRREKYDAIVSDYQMPGKNGLELLKELREENNDIPYIIFTGKGREELAIKELLNLGADGYFEKCDEPEVVYRELAKGINEVVEKKRVKDALGSSEAKYKSLLQNIPGMVYRALPDWSTEMIANSKSVCGYAIQEFDSGRVNWLDIIHPDDKARVVKEGGIILEGPASINQEYRIVDKESGVRWVEDHKTSFFSKNGAFEGIDGVVFDVTSRKKMEQALHASLDRYQSFIEVTEDLGWTTNAEGEVVEDTPSFRRFSGQTYEEVKGWGWTKDLHPDDLERITKIWKEATRTKSKYETEFRLRRHDGVYRYFIARGVPVLNEDGSIREWVGTCIDITERQQKEKELQKSEHKYKMILEGSNDGIIEVDPSTRRIAFANPAICRLTGYSEKELLKLKVEDIHPKEALPFVIEQLKKLALGEMPRAEAIPVLKKNKSLIYCHINGSTVEIEKRILIVAFFRDVTESREAEVRARAAEKVIMESQRKFEALFKDNPEATVHLDMDFRVLDVNPRFCQLFGYSAKEAKGKHMFELVVPEDKMGEAETLYKEARNGFAYYDTVRRRKDGSRLPVSISTAPITVEDKLSGYVSIYKDISGEKKLEEKLRVVGSLTRHDVRNKLTAVTGNTYLLRQKLAGDPKALERLKDIEAAVRQVERIFEFAMIYEKLGVEQLAYLDTKKILDEAASLFSDLKGVRIVNDCAGLTVLADSLMRQVFYNLIDNSLKYGERIKQIRVYYEEADSQLKLVYEDDGLGISSDMRDNLFKEGVGKGTGYGLFMIKRTIEVYGWNIQETGIQGKGVKFVITIPKTNANGKENYRIV